MAGGSLLALLDDITSLLDDIATMTKLATRKTAGVLSDDLALNAQQVSGVRANREIPVVWAVAKGSMLNKLVIIPVILLISQFVPILIKLLLIIGGIYLCFEGAEKIIHSINKLRHKIATTKTVTNDEQLLETTQIDEQQLRAVEKQKIKGAIRTDFILSVEIMVIALNVVLEYSLLTKIGVLLFVAFVITAGVYGIVTIIIKLDDLGYWLMLKNRSRKLLFLVGKGLINSAPYLMRFLSIVGTIAMFLVGGGIILHNIQLFTEIEHDVVAWITTTPDVGVLLGAISPTVISLIIGLVVGVLTLLIVSGTQMVLGKKSVH